jgi:hypothetical protein
VQEAAAGHPFWIVMLRLHADPLQKPPSRTPDGAFYLDEMQSNVKKGN